jgi:hypothetical protein
MDGAPSAAAARPERSAGSAADAGAQARRLVAEIGLRVAAPLLVLLGVVLAFAAIQNRLDRNDPKLRLASEDDEVVPFR